MCSSSVSKHGTLELGLYMIYNCLGRAYPEPLMNFLFGSIFLLLTKKHNKPTQELHRSLGYSIGLNNADLGLRLREAK